MEKFTILKNKGELFKCSLDIEGAEIKDTSVRLCLEFDDNKNMHFYGKLAEDGVCEIEIPILDIDKKTGKLTIEVIADSMFFKLYECEVDLKNSVEVKMTHKEATISKAFTPTEKKVGMSKLIQERNEKEPIVVEKLPETEKKMGLPDFNEYVNKKKKK